MFIVFKNSLALALTCGALPAWAAEVALAPHRAVYELSLLSTRGSEAPSSARGRIVYEFNGNACDGYTVNFRQATELVSPEGKPQVLDTRSATFESADGKTFRFRIETLTNGNRTKLLEGSAERASDALSISMKSPVIAKADLDVTAFFPVQQTVKGLEAARAGEMTLELGAYDGSGDGQKVYHSLNIIGRVMSKPSGDEVEKSEAMKDMKRWPVVASYFEREKPDGAPLYTLSFEMWDNGVSSNLKLDYGDFVLGGKVSQFELLKAGVCEAGK